MFSLLIWDEEAKITKTVPQKKHKKKTKKKKNKKKTVLSKILDTIASRCPPSVRYGWLVKMKIMEKYSNI
jgi:hypothetical protein